MIRRLLALCFLMAAAVLVNGDRLFACSCVIAPACTSVTDADAIFIGHVIEVEPKAATGRLFGPAANGPHARVRIRVQETFVGHVLGDVDLFPTDAMLADCYARFETSETYLVRADIDQKRGELVVGACGGARRVAEVPEADLTYLRSLPALPPETGLISGTALLYESTGFPASETIAPLPGVLVMGQSEGRTVTATTDPNGKYRIDAPPGRYAFTALPPEGLYVRGPGTTWTVNLRDPRGCVVTDIPVFVNGRIAGRLVDAGGAPVPHMAVAALWDRRGSGYQSHEAHATDEDGNFEIGGLAAGEYVIGLEVQRAKGVNELRYFPRIFFPGTIEPAATPTIALPRGARVELGTFSLPPGTLKVTIEGTVRDPQSWPVAGAEVSVFEVDGTDGSLLATAVTDSAGRFQRNVLGGRRYAVHVLWPRVPPSEVTVPSFEVTGDVHTLNIVLPKE